MDDVEAWTDNPAHRWVYNRLEVSYGFPAGVEPGTFPIIWKPIINLWGMGRGVEIVRSVEENDAFGYRPGFMWSPLLHGPHISVDAMVKKGVVEWEAHAVGIPAGPQAFAAWFLGDFHVMPSQKVAHFVATRLRDYTGPLNVELIGGEIIEVHLRLTKDWLVAGAYDDFPGGPRRMVGIPVFTPFAPGAYFPARVEPDDGDPRLAFLTARIA